MIDKIRGDAQTKLIFSVFDQELGPIPIYFPQGYLSENDVTDIIVQAATMGAFFSQQVKLDAAFKLQAIFPMNNLNKSAFIHIFGVPHSKFRGDSIICTLIFLTNLENQLHLFRISPFLLKSSNELVENLKSHIRSFLSDTNISQVDFSSVKRILDDFTPVSLVYEGPEEIEPLQKVHYLQSLNPHILRRLDQIIFSLLVKPREDLDYQSNLGARIVVLGGHYISKIQLRLTIESLKVFCPHKSPKICYWTDSGPIEGNEYDIVGTSRNNKVKYLTKGYLIIDLEQSMVYGGRNISNELCTKLADKVLSAKPEIAVRLISKQIDFLLRNTGKLIELLLNVEKEEGRSRVEAFVRMFDHGTITLIVSLAEATNPDLAQGVLFNYYRRPYFKSLLRRV